MVKYDNLYGNLQNKLHRLYGEIHPEPIQPEAAPIPKAAASQIVRGHGEARIYAEVPDGDRSFRSSHEVPARIVFTDGKDNHKLSVSSEELGLLIAELQRVKAAVEAVNEVLVANSTADKNYREAQDKYNETRRNFFAKKMATGKVTEAMIDTAESLKDLKLD